MLTIETVRDLLKYDEEDGLLFWKIRPISFFKSETDFKRWNTKYAGSQAGTIQSNGYMYLTILGKSYRYHRIVWFIYYGKFPKQDLDHIDHNKLNNRIENLREVTSSLNNKNRRRRGVFAPGIKQLSSGTFQSSITIDGKYQYLGVRNTLEEATELRKQAEIKYGFHENHGK